MVNAVRFALTLVLAMSISASLMAADEKGKGKGKGQAKGKKPAAKQVSIVRIPQGIELTADQKAKVAEINKEYGPQVAALRKEMAGIMTPEKRKAMAEARKAAAADGKKGKDALAAAEAAAGLTAADKAKLEEVRKKQMELAKAAKEKFLGVLTDDQKKSLKGSKPARQKPGKPAKPGKKEKKEKN